MEENNRLSIFNIGLLVIVVPAIIYIFIYMFEFGYMSSYGIPIEVISIDIGAIIPIIINSSSKIFLMLCIWILISEVFSIDIVENPIGFEVYKLIKVIYIFTSVALFSHNSIAYLESLTYILLFLIFLNFLFPLLSQRKVKGYKHKLIAQNELEYSLSKRNMFKSQLKSIGKDNITTLMIILFIALIMHQNGKSSAIANTEYYSYEDKVVIRIYNDYMVCVDYDEEKNMFINQNFKLINYKSLDSIQLIKITLEDVKFVE